MRSFTANYSFNYKRDHLRLIILSVGGDVPVDSEVLLVTDFVNLKIKPAQSFRSVHRVRVCVRVFIDVSACTCMSICVCTVFLKKIKKLILCILLVLYVFWCCLI
jgi:hypothetical protein